MLSKEELCLEFCLQGKNILDSKFENGTICSHSNECEFVNENSIIYMKCANCANCVNVQTYLYCLPWAASVYLANTLVGNLDASVLKDTVIYCNALVSMPDDIPTVVKVRLEDFMTMFRMFAMATGQFYMLVVPEKQECMEIDGEDFTHRMSLKEEIYDMCYSLENKQNLKALKVYESRLNLLINNHMSALKVNVLNAEVEPSVNNKLLLDMLNVVSSTMDGLKKNSECEAFNPVEMIKRSFLPELSLLANKQFLKEEIVVPDSLLCSALHADWFEYFQSLLIKARDSFGNQVHNIDFCISSLFLSLILMHNDHSRGNKLSLQTPCSIDEDIERSAKTLLEENSNKISLAEMTEEATKFNYTSIPNKIISMGGYMLLKFALGLKDISYREFPLVKATDIVCEQQLKMLLKKEHNNKYRYLKRNLSGSVKAPEKSQLEQISLIGEILKVKVRALVNKASEELGSEKLEEKAFDILFGSLYPYVLFLSQKDKKALVSYYCFKITSWLISLRQRDKVTGEPVNKITATANTAGKEIFNIFTYIEENYSKGSTNEEGVLLNPLTATQILLDEKLLAMVQNLMTVCVGFINLLS